MVAECLFSYIFAQVVSRTTDFVGILSVCLVELAATLVSTQVLFPASFLLPPRVLLSPSDNENPYCTKQSVGYARQAIFHSSARSLEKSAVSELPIFARQDGNNIPTVRTQFRPLTHNVQFLKSLNVTIHAPPLLRPCRYTS